MKGYWSEYSYVGLLPNGLWMRFSSDKEYEEMYSLYFSREDHASM